MKLEEYMRNWTDEQWADAEKVEAEAISMLGEDGDVGSLTVLVIEERKRDPATTVNAAANLAITLGVEALFSLRRAGGCTVSPDVAELAKARCGKKRAGTRRVRGL